MCHLVMKSLNIRYLGYLFTSTLEIPVLCVHRTQTWSSLLQRYCQTSKIRSSKSQNVNVSRLSLKLPLPNPLKSGVKSRLKMWLEQRRQAMLQLHLSDQQVYFRPRCTLYYRCDDILVVYSWGMLFKSRFPNIHNFLLSHLDLLFLVRFRRLCRRHSAKTFQLSGKTPEANFFKPHMVNLWVWENFLAPISVTLGKGH